MSDSVSYCPPAGVCVAANAICCDFCSLTGSCLSCVALAADFDYVPALAVVGLCKNPCRRCKADQSFCCHCRMEQVDICHRDEVDQVRSGLCCLVVVVILRDA